MTVYVKVLIPAKIAENAQTTQYTANGVTTIIDKFTATNYSATAATISVNLVTAADTAGNQNLIVKHFNMTKIAHHALQRLGRVFIMLHHHVWHCFPLRIDAACRCRSLRLLPLDQVTYANLKSGQRYAGSLQTTSARPQQDFLSAARSPQR